MRFSTGASPRVRTMSALLVASILPLASTSVMASDHATANCVQPPTGMLAWWGGDGNPADVFGSYGGILEGDTTYAPGIVGQAFSFDGAGDRVDMTGSAVGDFGSGPFTVAFWMNADNSLSGQKYLVGRSSPDDGQGWDIRQDGIGLRVSGVDGWAFNIITHDVLTVGNWDHIALSATADTGAGDDVRLYVNGELVGTSSRGTIGLPGNPMRLGMTTNYGGLAFNGLLDEVQLFDRSLTIGEVQSIVAAGADGSCRPCAALPETAIGWWRAEDNPDDEIGQLHGTLGGDTSYAAGKVGQAFTFDGLDDFVELPDSESWDFGAASFTLAAWFKSGTAGDYRAIMFYHQGFGGTGCWGVRFEPGGRVEMIVVDEAGSPILTLASTAVFADDEWHMVSAVRDAGAGVLSLYVDGVAAAAPVSDGALNVVGSADNRAMIGAGGWGSGGTFHPFAGEIDEVMIFDRALTLDEIQSLANADSTGVCTDCTEPPGGQISWWQGEDTADDSAGDNHGTEVNGANFAVGLVGQAFSFESLDDYVEIADDPSVTFAADQPMSIDLWAYRTGTAIGQHLIGKRSGCSAESFNYQIVLDLVTRNGLCFGANAGAEIAACSTEGFDDLPLDTWTHVAATFDGSTMRLYLDGQEAASLDSTIGTPDSAPLRIGTSGCAGNFGYDFEGLIDEVEIHDRALSRDEVYAVYSAGALGKCFVPDAEPDPFAFVDKVDVDTTTTVTSNSIVVSGINTRSTITVAACTSTSCEYSVNGGGWTAAAGTVMSGDSVEVRQLASAAFGSSTDLILDIGGVSDTFSVTTLVQYDLTVTVAGSGSGSVTSTPAGIDCPAAACAAPFDDGQMVTLTPSADAGSAFTGWTGDADCADGSVLMNSPVSCTANFGPVLIFADGFESGNSSSWTSTVP